MCEFSMLEDQRYILEEILTLLDETPVDGVLLAGDLYDKPVPPAEAVRLLDWFLTQLAARSVHVCMISGNHDSPERLQFGSDLLQKNQIHISGTFSGKMETVSLSDAYGTLTISMLIIIGSTGFVVFQDIYRKKVSTRLHRQHVEKLSFHAQVCLRASLTLLVFGTVMLFILEYNNTYRDLNFFEKLNAAFFQSVNTRTAGFASVSIKQETDGEKLLTSFLMFIGGCPGSTAGGIKVTTLVVLFAAVKSTLCGEDTTTFLRHRFDPGMVYKSLTVVAFALVVSVLNVSLILALHHGVSILDAIIEAVSAFATVGLSASLTPTLHPLAKLALTLTMFIGRVGPVSFGVAILMRKKKSGSVLPEGRMLIG